MPAFTPILVCWVTGAAGALVLFPLALDHPTAAPLSIPLPAPCAAEEKLEGRDGCGRWDKLTAVCWLRSRARRPGLALASLADGQRRGCERCAAPAWGGEWWADHL